MIQTSLFGKLSADVVAEENLECRKIVRQISELKLTQRQHWMIIYLLGLELENVDDCKMMSDFVKDYKGDIFLSNQSDDGEQDV